MKWKLTGLPLVVMVSLAAAAQTSNRDPHLITRQQSLGKLLPGADVHSLTTDASFKRVAYVVKHEGKEYAVVDGLIGRGYDKVAEKNEMYFSPDGKRLAYVAKQGKNSLVVVDGTEGKEYEFIYDLFNPIFSPDSKRIAYIAGTGPNSQWFAVLDGQEQKKYDLVESLIFSPDSKKFAYHADRSWNRGTCMVVNGVEGRQYSGISDATFSPDSTRLAYSAFKWRPDRSLAVIDGRDGREYEGSVTSVRAVSFSPDGRHTAYAVTGAGVNGIVRDEAPYQTLGLLPEHGNLIFSPDSQRLAYVANGASWMIVVDDKIFDDRQVRRYTKYLTFSPDSRHLAYVTRFDSPTNTGYDFAVRDGVVQKDSKNIFTRPYFSPNGKHLLYLLRIDDKEIPVYGEFRGSEYDQFVTYNEDLSTKRTTRDMRKPFALDQDGTLHGVVLRNGEIFRLELRIAED